MQVELRLCMCSQDPSVPLGRCANACVSFSLACCARGSAPSGRTSLCRWAVARTLASVFSWLALLWAAASGREMRLREFTLARCVVGWSCVSCFLARCARGGSKRSETAIARIYVRSLCRWAVAPTLVSETSVSDHIWEERAVWLYRFQTTFWRKRGLKSRFQSTFLRKGGLPRQRARASLSKAVCSNQWLMPFLRTRRHESLTC